MAQAPKAPPRETISLAAIQAPFVPSLTRVDECVEATLRPAAFFLEPVLGQVSGGKRLRPLVLLMCAGEASRDSEPAASHLGAAVELIHLASLMHDDVLDGAEERRGLPSAPAALGARRAVLAGDYLAAAAYQEIAAAQVPGAGPVLSEAVVRMTLSEVTATMSAGKLLAEPEYLEVIAGKTAALFAAAAQIGALVPGVDEQQAQGFYAYGHGLGMAFQIRDDLLDLYGDPLRLGKGVHRDLAAGLYTLPVIYAAESPDGERLKQLLAELRAASTPDGLVEEIAEMTRFLGGEARALGLMQRYAEEACEALPECPSRSSLVDLAAFVMARSN